LTRRNFGVAWRVLFLGLVCLHWTSAQEVVDRIVARVENDVILMSDVKQLKAYQELVDGQSESDGVILDRLIDQWVVRSEAQLSRFPQPTDAEIDRGVTRVVKSFATPEEYQQRRKQSGLSDAGIRKLVAGQLYLSNYLDSRFRPSAQVDDQAVADFYRDAVVPRAKAHGQDPPTLEASREIIEEALIEKDINAQADRWLKESRARLRVERYLDEGTK
jgi:hypothetical protein